LERGQEAMKIFGKIKEAVKGLFSKQYEAKLEKIDKAKKFKEIDEELEFWRSEPGLLAIPSLTTNLRVFFMLDMLDDLRGYAFPFEEYLAKELGKSVKTISRSVQFLQELDWIHIVRTKQNNYVLNPQIKEMLRKDFSQIYQETKEKFRKPKAKADQFSTKADQIDRPKKKIDLPNLEKAKVVEVKEESLTEEQKAAAMEELRKMAEELAKPITIKADLMESAENFLRFLNGKYRLAMQPVAETMRALKGFLEKAGFSREEIGDYIKTRYAELSRNSFQGIGLREERTYTFPNPLKL
jgi:hypothetical protein